MSPYRQSAKSAFTLIELSIVLVIIGLVIGGILVGRDLIKAAQIRSGVSQIEKYESAALTFKTKYNYLPGDLPAAQAASLGFNTRAGGSGNGDGDGRIMSISGYSNPLYMPSLGGETVLFWTDLSSASLIDGSFIDNSDATVNISSSTSAFAPYVPQFKLGSNAYVFAFENVLNNNGIPKYNGLVFGLGKPTDAGALNIAYTPAFSVYEIYAMDSKLDDGKPFTGSVLIGQAEYRGGNGSVGYRGGSFWIFSGDPNDCLIYTAAVPSAYNLAYPDNIDCSILIAAHM